MVLAAAIVAGLQALRAGRTSSPVQLLAITMPSRLAQGESAKVFGGLVLPKGEYEARMWACSGSRCRRTSVARFDGAGTYWGWLGTERVERGGGTAALRIYRVDTPWGGMVLKRSQRVAVE